MKYFTILITLFFSQFTFAQTPNYIEITVGDAVKLSAKSVVVSLFVYSIEEQMNNQFYYSSIQDEYDEYDYYYYNLLEEEPKKVTKAMKKAYEQSLIDRKVRLEEFEQEKADFLAHHVYKLSDLQVLLNENGITYKEVKAMRDTYYVDLDEGD